MNEKAFRRTAISPKQMIEVITNTSKGGTRYYPMYRVLDFPTDTPEGWTYYRLPRKRGNGPERQFTTERGVRRYLAAQPEAVVDAPFIAVRMPAAD